ncbi:hypothetical protein [Streptomyces djakartensis]|uniref:Secreted protein n=1 Tax=Streptomyces djakartensis TaxID=68193 RepID=A0ABQ2ZND2_9ACTN|nr:hypothetical protein [Streptomyces djakartensis]GGY18099.1 hypothetical protein GCM10010384_25480 [Streptomyces djakartensis]
MCALPAWRIASSALCATLLVGIAGPAAMAAEPAPEHRHAASSPGARPTDTDARLEQLRKLYGDEFAPVVDLLVAALKANNGQLTAAEARKVAEAAKAALAEMAAKIRMEAATPSTSAPATDVLPSDPVTLPSAPVALPSAPVAAATESPSDASDTLESALDEVEQAVDDLLSALGAPDETSESDTASPPSVDDLLSEVDDLIDALIDRDPAEQAKPEPTTLPSLWPLTSPPSLSPVTLPAITSALLDS